MTHYTLGISAFYHDSAAALVKDGLPCAAAQQERFSRIRHDATFPAEAITYCLDEADIWLDDLDCVVYYEDSELKYQRILSSFASAGWSGFSRFIEVFPQWRSRKRNIVAEISERLRYLDRGESPPVIASQHHRSHAASAFYPSPFPRAAVLCIDGVGEWDTTTLWQGDGSNLQLVNSIPFPHSLGFLYSAFTYYCGFKVDSGEYKLMGLAPYGKPTYARKIRDELINLRPDGSFSLNMHYFEYLRGRTMLGERFERLFGGERRQPESAVTQRDCDLAASVQAVTEEAVLGLAKAAISQTGETRLCLAGGVALNCVANGALRRSGLIEDLWIQPAAGDAGCALGAAMDKAVARCGRNNLPRDAMRGAFLGPEFKEEDICYFLERNRYPYQVYSETGLFDEAATHLANGKVLGWFQGRMEFGPRALGARSILADPRDPEMQRKLNLKIKFRESFRPFAPVVLADDAHLYFDTCHHDPYMLLVSHVRKDLRVEGGSRTGLGEINAVRSQLPAITHVDYSARVQTVSKEENEKLFRLLTSFKHRTGCSVLINTSFNVRGEPIVLSPEHAYVCFMRTDMDVLVLGRHVLIKEEQPRYTESSDWRTAVALD